MPQCTELGAKKQDLPIHDTGDQIEALDNQHNAKRTTRNALEFGRSERREFFFACEASWMVAQLKTEVCGTTPKAAHLCVDACLRPYLADVRSQADVEALCSATFCRGRCHERARDGVTGSISRSESGKVELELCC